MRSYKRILSVLIASTMAAGVWAAQHQASADVLTCPKQDGAVRVWDGDVNRCGILDQNNPDWRNIGNPPWNDRIDQFGNDDFIQHRTMCLFQDIFLGGAKVALPPGNVVTWNNIVSSNRWTSSNCNFPPA